MTFKVKRKFGLFNALCCSLTHVLRSLLSMNHDDVQCFALGYSISVDICRFDLLSRKWTDLDEIWNSVSQTRGAGPGRFWARSAQQRQIKRDRFSKKQKLLTKFPGLATSSLVSIFTVRITSNSFFWNVRCAPEKDLRKFSVTLVVRYCPIVHCSNGAARSHRYSSGAV